MRYDNYLEGNYPTADMIMKYIDTYGACIIETTKNNYITYDKDFQDKYFKSTVIMNPVKFIDVCECFELCTGRYIEKLTLGTDYIVSVTRYSPKG